MQNTPIAVPNILGTTLKTAREQSNITIEALADKVDITSRYLYRIENENQKPSFKVLYRIVRALDIPGNDIFYPENSANNLVVEEIIQMLYKCDAPSLSVIKATINATLNNQPKE